MLVVVGRTPSTVYDVVFTIFICVIVCVCFGMVWRIKRAKACSNRMWTQVLAELKYSNKEHLENEREREIEGLEQVAYFMGGTNAAQWQAIDAYANVALDPRHKTYKSMQTHSTRQRLAGNGSAWRTFYVHSLSDVIVCCFGRMLWNVWHTRFEQRTHIHSLYCTLQDKKKMPST